MFTLSLDERDVPRRELPTCACGGCGKNAEATWALHPRYMADPTFPACADHLREVGFCASAFARQAGREVQLVRF